MEPFSNALLFCSYASNPAHKFETFTMKSYLLLLVALIISHASANRLRGAKIHKVLPRRDARKLIEVDVFLSEGQNTPQYVQNQNSMLSFVKMVKHEPRHDPEEYKLPSYSKYVGDEILGRLEGLLPTETKFHNDNYFLSMAFIDPNFDSLGYESIGVIDMIPSEKIVNPLAFAYRVNPIPYGEIVGFIGLIGAADDRAVNYFKQSALIDSDVPYVSLSSVARSTFGLPSIAPAYKDLAFGLVDLIDPDDRISADAFKTVPPHSDELIGRLDGLITQTRFHNDNLYLTMALTEHHYEAVHSNDFMPFLDILDGQTEVRVAAEAYQNVREKLLDGIVGLIGLQEAPDANPFITKLSDDDIIMESSIYSQSDFFGIIDMVVETTRVHPLAYHLPSYHYDQAPGFIIGRIEGKLADDGFHTYENALLRSADTSDQKLSGMATGSSTGTGRLSIAFFSTLDKITVSKISGVESLVHENGQDILDHFATAMPSPRPSVAPSSAPSLHPSSLPTEPPQAAVTQSMLALSTETQSMFAVCGSTFGDCSVKEKEDPVSALHNVMCCSDTVKEGFIKNAGCGVWADADFNGVCIADVTFDTAASSCEAMGARLCTKTEVDSDCAAGTGCSLDHALVWTSTVATSTIASSVEANN